MSNAPIFQQDRFIARQKIIALAPQFRFTDLNGNTLAFLRQKVLTLKDEIHVYTDDTLTTELLLIKARQIIDWGAAFDVTDSITHQKVGTLKRRGWKSLLRAEWTIMDAQDQEIGKFQEGSKLLAFLRRTVSKLLPQSYNFEIRGQQVGIVKQRVAFLAPRMDADFSTDPGRTLDRRLAAAAVVLLMSVEGREQK
ncbi:MAG TPA: hypothetical protein VJ723_13125 [Candidatus Angelobacter sp.]|nr:hypothetical protein [Candidatus Angelobacter sp.]